jgi:AraC-like DNA-binding protein/mannose-6-phosphate isomerase-like protein (cupin superfamily)
VDPGQVSAARPLPESGILVFESCHSTQPLSSTAHTPHHKLVWAPLGRGYVESAGREISLRRDALFLIPAGFTYRLVDDAASPLTLVMAIFTPAVVQQSAPLAQLVGMLPAPEGGKLAIGMLNSYRREAVRSAFKRMLLEQSRGAIGAAAMLHVGLVELLVHLVRAEPGRPEQATRAESIAGTLEYLDDYFHTAIGVNDLAQMCGISGRRYSELFKRKTGKTVVQYLNEKRIAYAKARLVESKRIAFAAFAAGFGDVPHFYRVFKKVAGVTPGQYLEQVAAGVG